MYLPAITPHKLVSISKHLFYLPTFALIHGGLKPNFQLLVSWQWFHFKNYFDWLQQQERGYFWSIYNVSKGTKAQMYNGPKVQGSKSLKVKWSKRSCSPKVKKSNDPKVWGFVKVSLRWGAFPAPRQWQWQWQWWRGQRKGRPRACNGSHPKDGSFSSSSDCSPICAKHCLNNSRVFPASDMSFSEIDHNV